MKEEDYSTENLKKFKYIDCVQKETTRFFGPANGVFMRKCINDHILGNVPIHKGTLAGNQPIGIHYAEKYYQNPTVFNPDRWLEECKELLPEMLVGFSAGPRTCIGKHLALLESKIGLIKFMKRYELELPVKEIELSLKLIYQPKPFKSKLRPFKHQ